MPLAAIETYYNISDKKRLFSDIYTQHGNSTVFIVPSSSDKEIMLEMVIGDAPFMGRKPDIWTWSDFYRRVCSKNGGGFKPRRIIDPPDHHLIIEHVLRDYISRSEEAGIKLPPGVRQRGFVSLLGRNMKDLLNEDILPERLSEALLPDDGAGFSVERLLRDLYLDYMAYLEENGLADTAQVATLTREALLSGEGRDFVASRRFVIAGFLSFTGGQLKLLRELFDIAECTAVLPETGLDSFHDGIKQIGSDYGSRPEWSVPAAVLTAGNSNLQFDALAREFALWIGGRGAFLPLGELRNYGELGVQVRPEHLKEAQNAFARYGVPVSLRVRETVGDTLFGSLPRLIWSAYESGWSGRETVIALSNPLMGCLDFDASAFADLPEGAEGWKNALTGRGLEVFRKMEELCEALCGGGTPAEVMSLWLVFVKDFDMPLTAARVIGDISELDQSVRDIAYSINALENKTLILEDLTKSIGPAADVTLSGGGAVSFLTDWATASQLQTHLPQSGALSLYAGSIPVLASHRYWTMTDIDYSTCPGNLKESPLLGNDKKRLLNESMDAGGDNISHIPEIHEEREQKEALFRRLVATAQDAVIIARSAVDSSGRPVGSSPFVEAMFDNGDPKRKVQLMCEVEYPLSRALPRMRDDRFPEAEVLISSAKLDRGIFPRIGAVASEVGKPAISLSSIDDWLLCPFLYWCRKKLRLEKPSGGLFDNIAAGIFLHALWEECLKESKMPHTLLSEISAMKSGELMERYYPELKSDPRLRRHRSRLSVQIEKMACLQAEIFARANAGGVTEDGYDMKLEYKLPDFELEGAIFRGRCDRVDFYGNSAIILDYKLGKTDSYKQDIQLAAYSAVLKEADEVSVEGYGWLGHGDSKLAGYFLKGSRFCKIYTGSSGSKQKKDLPELIDEALSTMENMALSVRSGEYPANYDARRGSSRYCPRCDFKTLCRRSESPYAVIEEDDNGAGVNYGG
jgi:CRISPR/Cas system-associated exonuclease Cas4 (RecB family)